MSSDVKKLSVEAIALLKKLIAAPSFSKEEDQTAAILGDFFARKSIPHFRIGNNVYAFNKHFDDNKSCVLLNSHHDTVRPNKGYTVDPFSAIEKDGKLYGLGSNDAGGCLVSLIAAFLHFYDKENLPYNLVIAASAEEEISGKGGIEHLMHSEAFNPPNRQWAFGIVGEPTQMQMAVAEKGLMVLDCIAEGKAGHAARDEGENAIYKALKDIEWFSSYRFPEVSCLLGPVKMSVTVIDTDNKTHNVVPAQCHFVVDVRMNECYDFETALSIIRQNVQSSVTPRSLRLRSTGISLSHPIVQAGISLGRTYYGSPTMSDKALIPFETLKIGPGDSARSHTADEYIHLHEIEEGIGLYIQLLEKVLL